MVDYHDFVHEFCWSDSLFLTRQGGRMMGIEKTGHFNSFIKQTLREENSLSCDKVDTYNLHSSCILQITNLHKRFGEKEVLKGLELFIPQNSVFGFIGKNGAGKTTTMKTILGLLKADLGEIYVADKKVIYGQTETNRYIGYLPDVPEFYSFMNAKEYLTFCGDITGMSKSESKSRSIELLELVGLKEEKHRIKGFSRGMKQRLGIAQALLNRPKLLICDEPTSALDPIGRKEILDILFAVREQTTVLFSTHILSDVERICTDVAFLDNGVVSMQGQLSDIKTKYRKEEYILEIEQEADMLQLQKAFCNMRQLGRTQLVFCEKEHNTFEVLRFIADRNIPLLKMERVEPTLETLFMEVVEQ